jgi:hypothetical protein
MPRRRVYIINLEDLLREPQPPSRVMPFLRMIALILGLLGFGVVLIQILDMILPDDLLPKAVPYLIAYAAVILLFSSLAPRINHP